MPQTWKSAPGGTHTCPSCGALYEVTLTRLPVRDHDTADCSVCGQQMAEWNDTTSRSFRLMRKPETESAERSGHG